MISVEEFSEMKAKIEKKKSELERKKGELDGLMKTLAEEFDCHSIEEAEALLAKLKEQEGALQSRIDAKSIELEEAWNDYCKAVKGASE